MSLSRSSSQKISTGKAVRIFTGACIPEGANKVIIQENVRVLPKNKIKIIDASNNKNLFVRKKVQILKKVNTLDLIN